MLLAGLLLFFALHSVNLFAAQWRLRFIARHGALVWRVGYSLTSLLALALIVAGYSQWQLTSPVLYAMPSWLSPLVSLLMMASMISLVASFVPCWLQSKLKHPQLNAIKFWTLAHLLATGKLIALLVFFSFLVWAVLLRINLKKRGLAAPAKRAMGSRDALVVGAGLLVYAGWVLALHQWLIGVPLH